MKWRTTLVGDVRERRFLAIIPRPCDDGQTRWLEWLTVTEEYMDRLWMGGMWVPIALRPREVTE